MTCSARWRSCSPRVSPRSTPAIPTLDLHIALVRRWLVQSRRRGGRACTPRLPGCELLATLTHDIDFLGIRRHTRDRTLLGFLYRASIGSVDGSRSRDGGSVRRAAAQLAALVASLPLVYAGVIEDFWLPFGRYVEADARRARRSSSCRSASGPGSARTASVDRPRGVPYAASEIAAELRDTRRSQGHEIAVHGIDAWRDADPGGAELADDPGRRRRRGRRGHGCTGCTSMTAPSPQLENGRLRLRRHLRLQRRPIGFRAGHLAGVRAARGRAPARAAAARPGHVAAVSDPHALRPAEARCRLRELSSPRCAEHGGVATISWHERSLSPERLWDDVYARVRALLRSAPRGRSPGTRGRGVVPARGAASTWKASAWTSPGSTAAPSAEGRSAALRVRIHRAGGHTDLALTLRGSARRRPHAAPQPVGS